MSTRRDFSVSEYFLYLRVSANSQKTNGNMEVMIVTRYCTVSSFIEEYGTNTRIMQLSLISPYPKFRGTSAIIPTLRQ